MTRTWNGRVRPITGLAATLTLVLLVFAGAGPALALQAGAEGDGTTSTTTTDGSTGSTGSDDSDGSDGSPADGADHSQGTAGTEGGYDQPQPTSTADQNSGGANGDCPDEGSYCSTRDGSPSMNGNGGGKSVGKPCAGCVGRADNKNPKGQYPDGSDANAGYECDTNHGVGRSNPAHTGCTEDSTASPARTALVAGTSACSSDAGMASGDERACGSAPDAAPGAGGAVTAGAVGAARPAAVLGVEAFAQPTAGTTRPAVVRALDGLLPSGVLPRTGAGAALMLLLVGGVAAVAVGTVTLVARRRARA